MKVYLHLGPPKTASTFLQKNIFPNINEIYYFGKTVNRKNNPLFLKFYDYVMGSNQSKKIYYEKNKKNLKKLQLDVKKKFLKTDKKVLISAEDFLTNFSSSYFEVWFFKYSIFRKMSFIKVFKLDKIQRLINFFDEINIDIKFLLIYRKPKNRIIGMYKTLFDRMKLIDKKYNLNSYMRSYLNKPREIEKIFFNQFFYTDTIKFIKSYNKKFNIIDYELIAENKYFFINKIFDFLEIKKLNKDEINKLFIFEKVNQTKSFGNCLSITAKKNNITNYLSSIYNYNPLIKKFLKIFFKNFKTNKEIFIKIDTPILNKVLKKIDIEDK